MEKLNEFEIELMNEVKSLGYEIGALVEKLQSNDAPIDIDQRWVSEGKMDLQKGLMCLTRSIAKPDLF